jgi:hypothetical protein
MICQLIKVLVCAIVGIVVLAAYAGLWLYTAFLDAPELFIAMLVWHGLLLGVLYWLKREPGRDWLQGALGIVFLAGIGLPSWAAIGSGVNPRYDPGNPDWIGWIVAAAAVVGLFFAIYGVHLIRAKSPRIPAWNTSKGLSGTVFGDSANFVAVVAGLGSYSLMGGGIGWWRIGFVGGLLALLVGLSLHYRWVRNTAYHRGDAPKLEDTYGSSDDEKAVALFSEAVGVFTLLSLLSPTEGSVQLGVLIARNIVGLMIVLVALVLASLYLRRCSQNEYARQQRFNLITSLLSTCVILILSIAAILAFLVVTVVLDPPPKGFKTAGQVFGILGAWFWLLCELLSSFPVTLKMMHEGVEPLKAKDFWGWRKNLVEALGALATMIVLIVFAFRPDLNPEGGDLGSLGRDQLAMGIFFLFGAIVSGLGTLGGIAIGVFKLATRPESAAGAQPARSRAQSEGAPSEPLPRPRPRAGTW